MDRVRVRVTGAWLAVVVVLGSLLGIPVTTVGRTPSLLAPGTFGDSNFRELAVFTGLTHPVAVRFATDGRVFVAEKEGVVKAFDSLSDTTATTVIDLRSTVSSYWDRGLLGFAVDPRFLAGRPYLYLYYVYDAPPGGTAPTWGDGCPNPPGATADGCVVTSRVDRVTVNPATNVSTARSPLIRDWCQQFPSHSGGGIAVGGDGQLYVSGGEGAAFTGGADYGQRGGTLPNPASPVTPVDPCGDPVTVTRTDGQAPEVDATTAEGGSLRSQDLRTTGDPVGLGGSLIRVDPDTGLASAGNPLAASLDVNARRIVAHGLRNPFRLTFRPGTSEIYVGDVGNTTWEEIERIVPPTGARTPTTMPNFGWPCYEGAGKQSPWATMANHLCDGLYAAGSAAITPPLYAYNHSGTAAPCGVTGGTGAAVAGLAFYDAAAADLTAYPARFDGALFFVDYSRNCLAAILPGTNGVPDPSTMEVVGRDLGHPVDLVTGPHGDLYYPDLDGGRVVRIRYAQAPVAHATATPGAFLAPGTVHLDASGSLDPDPVDHLVAWQWDLDHDGTFGGPADLAGETVDWTLSTPAHYPVTLRVQSSNGLSDTTELEVDATDDPPVPVIASPTADLTWAVGDAVAFSGSATDAQDGALTPGALRWDIVMHHCTGLDCHEHIVETIEGVASGTFIAPDHEYPSYLEVRLTATDGQGQARRTGVSIQPRTTTLSLNSVPTGVPLAVDGTTVKAPGSVTLIRGASATVVAAPIRSIGGSRYRFSVWSDGKAAAHSVTVTDPASLVATYVPDAGDTCATAHAIRKGTWVADRASGNGDQDWFRFTLATARRVTVTLGDLPVAARLELYRTCSGGRVAVSDRAGTSYEEITRSLAAGTYRVRVALPAGARSASPYALRARTYKAPLAVKSATVHRSGGSLWVAGEVLNASGGSVGRVGVTATFRDAGAAVVGRLSGVTFAYRLGDRGVSPFILTGTVPAYSTVTYTLGPAQPLAARVLDLVDLALTANGDGTVTETGVVRNAGTASASGVAVARTWYGRRGEVLEVRMAAVTPSVLAPGSTGTFTVLRPVLANVQGARTQIRAR